MEPSVVIAGLIGLGSGLSKDIIFSWLKGDRLDAGVKKECLAHADRMARAEERLDQHEKDLASGDKKFDEFQKSISSIEKNVGILVDRAGHRRGDD